MQLSLSSQTKYSIMHRNFYFFILMILIPTFAVGQGVTTSSLVGKVVDTNSEALIGVNVVVTNGSTGAVYGTVTDLDGNYRLNGLKVGGPYEVKLTYVGFQDLFESPVYLRLGEQQKRNYVMSTSAQELETIEVVASSGSGGENSGTRTQVSTEELETLPTLTNSLFDFTRLTPQATTTFDGGFSVAGINNRYNAIYIDGAVNNDVFGLSASGTNGGQTGISPVSLFVLDQVQVVVSPYDVTLGGFAGAGINAVTKSGTNKWMGDIYYYMQNENLAGKTNKTISESLDSEREKLDEFSNKLYGASVGGPLVKNKVFFFGNVEIQRDETPVPFDFASYEGNTTQAELESLSNLLQNTYDYDPGGFLSKSDKLDGLKLFGKLDINLSDQHKLSLRHQFTKAEQTNVNGSNNGTINFENNGVYFPSTTNSFAAELNSMLSNTMSNNFILGITSVRDDRDPIGGNFPYLDIDDGEGGIRIGSEQFSTANQLDQTIFTVTNNLKLYRGKHTFTVGTHNELSNFYNLFIRQNYGVYEYDSLSQFLTGLPASAYTRSYSLVDEKTGDGSDAGAEFTALQIGLYAQDEMQLSDDFNLTVGLRVDVPIILDDPTTDEYFNSTALPAIEGQYDTEGAKAGAMPEGQLMFSPRLGFTYRLADQTRLRGGLGIFTSRIPFVWPAGAYSNNGLTIGGVDEDDLTPEDMVFNGDFEAQPTNPDFTVPSGQMDLFASDFKYPQLFRTSLGLDHNLGNGFFAGIDLMYSKTLNNVFYQNINSDNTVDFNWSNGGDDRPIYTRTDIDPTYSAVYLATNTNEGYSYNLGGNIGYDRKLGDNAISISLAYNYGNSFSIHEGSSSQNSSQWRGAFHVDGRNDAALGVSDFAQAHRIVGSLGYTANWGGSEAFGTTFSLFYNGQSGAPFSYVYGSRDGRNINNETGSTSRNRSLIYIPANEGDIVLVENDAGESPDQQWDALDQYIKDDEYLADHRGEYAEKNMNRTPFTNMFDLKILQNIGYVGAERGYKLQASFDIFNLGNLISSKAGVVYSNPFAYEIISFEGYDDDGVTPTFTFNETQSGDDRFFTNDRLSRWRMRVGLRLIFN